MSILNPISRTYYVWPPDDNMPSSWTSGPILSSWRKFNIPQIMAKPAKLNVNISKAINDIGAKPSGVDDRSMYSSILFIKIYCLINFTIYKLNLSKRINLLTSEI